MRTKLALIAGIGFLALQQVASATDPILCRQQQSGTAEYTICKIDPRTSDIRLYWKSASGLPLTSLRSLDAELGTQKLETTIAMNAGMYDWKLAPVGLFIENGKALKPLNQAKGTGNFHLKPNGVFYMAQGRAGVMEAAAYGKFGVKADYATQSGPMLVIRGQLHPKLAAAKRSLKYRNGVGVQENGRVVFAISNAPVSFADFAVLFRDELQCANALYLDGTVSSLRVQGKTIQGDFWPLGPMIGVTAKAR